MLITLQVGSSVTVNNISSSKLLDIVKKKKINLNFFPFISFFLEIMVIHLEHWSSQFALLAYLSKKI